MSDHSELKKLAEAAPSGPWRYWGETANEIFQCSGKRVLIIAHDQSVPACEFIAAANPAAVLALIAEVEGLHAQHGRDSAELRSLCQARDDARKERDQLKAKIEALRKDAERYRWLRSGSDYEVALHEGPELDKVIDRAMSEAAKS